MTGSGSTRWIAALLAVGALLPAASGLAGGKKASFVDGVYAMEGRCEKLAALEAGGPRSAGTVPETLTADGFETWEGGCTFDSITEKEKGRTYVTSMSCGEAAEEWTETDTFTVDPNGDSITVTVDGKSTRYVKCASAKGN